MAPRNRFESEYKANFKPHEVTPVSSRQPQSQIKPNIKEDVPPRAGGLKKKEDLLKPAKAAVKEGFPPLELYKQAVSVIQWNNGELVELLNVDSWEKKAHFVPDGLEVE